jgi:two-component system, cell cycle sensor histidine kinase and response regulator CckA
VREDALLAAGPNPGTAGMVGVGNGAPTDGGAGHGSENIQPLLFEQVPSAVAIGEVVFDEAGALVDYRVVAVNPAFERLIGVKAEQVVGRRVSELRPDLRHDLIERLGRVAAGGQPEQFEGRDPRTDRSVLIRLSHFGSNRLLATIEDLTEMRRAEAALRERNAFVETILASTGDGLVVFDRDLRVTVWNPAMEEMLGLTADLVLGRRLVDASSEAVAVDQERVVVEVLETGHSQWREFALPSSPGRREGWARALYEPHRDAGGRIVGVVASIRDITPKHAGEAMLRDQAVFVQELLNAIPTPITAKDRDGRVLVCNDAYAFGNYGLPRDQVVGKTNRELGQRDAAMHAEHDRKAMRSGVPEVYEADRYMADGTVRRHVVIKAPIRSASGEITGTVTADQDITERHAAEQALRRSEERFRTLFDFASDAIFIHGVGGSFVEVNRTACQRLGYSRDELLAMSPTDIDAPEFAPLVAEREAVLEREGTSFFETAHIRKDGTVIPVEVSATIIDLGGDPAVLSIARDVGERRRAEAERNELQEQLASAQKMEAIGRLAGGVAHDFNNLLTAIRGFAELHLADHPPGDAGRADVLEIERAADRATQLTAGLLAFARRAEAHAMKVDLPAIVRDTMALLRRLVGEDVVIRLDADSNVPLVLVDPVQIEQVLLNLAANARDAMPAGGTLVIAVKPATLTKAFVKSHAGARTGHYVLLEVSDTGVGMDETTRAHIFEPFFTTKRSGEGTGLGLASVYGIVKVADGYIDVRSRPGHGSVFRAYFPAVEGAKPSAEVAPSAVDAHRGANETILLVEDEPAVRQFAQRVLQERGYRVHAYGDPAAALEAATRDLGSYDALVSDIVMPSMSGPALAERILAARPDLPVLFMSGYEAGALPEGAPKPLAKPFTARDLAVAVGALFGRSD